MPFEDAGPAEILRAVQKDNGFLDSVKNSIADIFQKSLGTQLWLKYHKWIDTCCELVYLSLTTLTLHQTLGEEYTGLLLISRNKRSLPSTLNRILMVCLQCLGPTIVGLMIRRLAISLESGSLSTYLRPKVKGVLRSQMPVLKAFPSFFLRLHLATFYLRGTFYHLAKRIMGIRYVLLRSWFGDESVVKSFQLLGSIVFFNIFLASIYSFYELTKNKENFKERHSESSSDQCPLCLDRSKFPSVTPCGHLFCWNCIHESLQTNNVCPLCRHPSSSHQIVPLMNY